MKCVNFGNSTVISYYYNIVLLLSISLVTLSKADSTFLPVLEETSK